MDITRYLDDLGYDAIQDWTYRGISNFDAVRVLDNTGIADKSARNAGWVKEGKKTYVVSVICDIDFENETRVLRDWDEPSFPKIDKS